MSERTAGAAGAPPWVTMFTPIAKAPVGRGRSAWLQWAHHHSRPEQRPAADDAGCDHRRRRSALDLGPVGRRPLGSQSARGRQRDHHRPRSGRGRHRDGAGPDAATRVLPGRPWSRGAGHAVRCPASSASSMGSISTIRSKRPMVDLSSSSTRCDHVKRVTLDVFEPGRARPSRTMVTRRRSRPRR